MVENRQDLTRRLECSPIQLSQQEEGVSVGNLYHIQRLRTTIVTVLLLPGLSHRRW